jgi:glycosyltransferase involved in cell wall biosynthesis
VSTILLPASVVIPTRNREVSLRRTLESLGFQSHQPAEIIVADSSDDSSTAQLCQKRIPGLESQVRWLAVRQRGAGVQRNEGVAYASHSVIAFMDDDIRLEPECMSRLWQALESDPRIGGASAMITNQRYQPPGRGSRLLYRLMKIQPANSYAGRCIGPALNLLPQDALDLPDQVSVEWLNTTCTMYRRLALPSPPFDEHFVGYSMMEDLALSLTVRKRWRLVNARTARIFHDSQPGSHKCDPRVLAEMELINRHYVMTRVLGKRRITDYVNLAMWEGFTLVAAARDGCAGLRPILVGKLRGLAHILVRLKA